MFGFLRRKKLGPEKTGGILSANESLSAYSNLWREIEKVREDQRLIMNHLGIRIVSYPRIEKYEGSGSSFVGQEDVAKEPSTLRR